MDELVALAFLRQNLFRYLQYEFQSLLEFGTLKVPNRGLKGSKNPFKPQ
jgi:hypothetical protein